MTGEVRVIRWSTALAVLGVAAVADEHAYGLVWPTVRLARRPTGSHARWTADLRHFRWRCPTQRVV